MAMCDAESIVCFVVDSVVPDSIHIMLPPQDAFRKVFLVLLIRAFVASLASNRTGALRTISGRWLVSHFF